MNSTRRHQEARVGNTPRTNRSRFQFACPVSRRSRQKLCAPSTTTIRDCAISTGTGVDPQERLSHIVSPYKEPELRDVEKGNQCGRNLSKPKQAYHSVEHGSSKKKKIEPTVSRFRVYKQRRYAIHLRPRRSAGWLSVISEKCPHVCRYLLGRFIHNEPPVNSRSSV